MSVDSTFRRSSYCDTNACVEVAFQRSSYCDSSDCVEVAFRKATASVGGNCVEVGACNCGDVVVVRDSKDPDGPVLSFTADEFRAFVDGVKAGEFDFS